MKKYISNLSIKLSIIVLIIGELVLLYGMTNYGTIIHIFNIMNIILFLTFKSAENERKKGVLLGLMMISLFRIANLATPKLFTIPLIQFSIIYGTMFLAIYIFTKDRDISLKELGMRFDKFHIYLPMALVTGIVTAFIEYYILMPEPLINRLNISNIILISLVMIVFVATVEEIIFRSIVQTELEKLFNLKNGLIIGSLIFGIVHISYGDIEEIIFTVIFGAMLGYIYQRTRSLPFIIAINGIENIMLLGILSVIL